MELDLNAQTPDARPPPEWAGSEGQQGVEKIVPRMHLTLYVEVCPSPHNISNLVSDFAAIGWTMGQDDRGGESGLKC